MTIFSARKKDLAVLARLAERHAVALELSIAADKSFDDFAPDEKTPFNVLKMLYRQSAIEIENGKRASLGSISKIENIGLIGFALATVLMTVGGQLIIHGNIQKVSTATLLALGITMITTATMMHSPHRVYKILKSMPGQKIIRGLRRLIGGNELRRTRKKMGAYVRGDLRLKKLLRFESPVTRIRDVAGFGLFDARMKSIRARSVDRSNLANG